MFEFNIDDMCSELDQLFIDSIEGIFDESKLVEEFTDMLEEKEAA